MYTYRSREYTNTPCPGSRIRVSNVFFCACFSPGVDSIFVFVDMLQSMCGLKLCFVIELCDVSTQVWTETCFFPSRHFKLCVKLCAKLCAPLFFPYARSWWPRPFQTYSDPCSSMLIHLNPSRSTQIRPRSI